MKLQRYINESTLALRYKIAYDEVFWELTEGCKPFLKELEKSRVINFLYRGHGSSIKTIKEKKSRTDRTPRNTDAETHEKLDDLFNRIHKFYARSGGIFATGSTNEAANYGYPYLFFPIGKYKFVWNKRIQDIYSYLDDDNIIVPNEDEIIDEISGQYGDSYEDYDKQYGEGEEGEYHYDKNELGTNSADEAYELVIDDIKERLEWDDDTDTDPESEFDENLLVWVPEKTPEEFAEEEIDTRMTEWESNLKNIVSDYQTWDLQRAITSKNEIMFKCKSYFLVHRRFEDQLKTDIKLLKL
jgi:hypothetical protein